MYGLVVLALVLINSRIQISAEVVVTCDGSAQRLNCDTGVISVQSATFGRRSKEICIAGIPPSQISTTDCSIDVPEISRRCNGLRVCELDHVGLAPSDPCFGIYKYFTVNYTCKAGAKTNIVCSGGFTSLRCETGKIQLNTVYYGRRDSITCSQGRPSSQLQNTKCYSPTKLASLSKSCNDKESCEVAGFDNPDPCLGIYKYLDITYFCNTVYSSIACEDQESVLTCEQGKAIHVQSANYGRTDSKTCSAGRPASQVAKTDCYSSISLNIVTQRCEGKNTCNILASNSIFSDPCVNTFKYLNISYSCVLL